MAAQALLCRGGIDQGKQTKGTGGQQGMTHRDRRGEALSEEAHLPSSQGHSKPAHPLAEPVLRGVSKNSGSG